MNKALNLFSNLLRALADQIDNISPAAAAPPNTGPAADAPPSGEAPPPVKRRGRPPGSTAAPPPAAETPAPPVEEKEAPVTGGKTYEELQAIIMPFVKGTWANPPQPRTADVKKAIAKYAPADWPAGTTFGLQALAALPQHHAAFEAEIAALAY